MARNNDDLTIMNGTDDLGFQVGKMVLQTHDSEKCEGLGPCVIHNPSNHHMRTWELNWRADTRVMERLCPHGIGHPDPDHMAHVRSLTPEHNCPNENNTWPVRTCEYPHLEWQGIHGCDGCCASPPEQISSGACL